MSSTKWPLCADVFTWVDKLKIAHFLFTERIWTYGEWIKRYEAKWSEYLGGTHAIMVSSGSTANELIALRRKWELQQASEWPHRNRVVFPVNTWISSVSPWVNAGFEPVFTDVQRDTLNMDSMDLVTAFWDDSAKRIGTVFYTALLGLYGNIDSCKEITERHGARFLMDNCEATFSSIDGTKLLSYATCSTSVFYSHFTTTGTEGGFIFTRDPDEADWYRMARNHGMTRGMPAKYRNFDVNAAFDFHLMGSNYRSSNLQAFMGLLDFDRALRFSEEKRRWIMGIFHSHLDPVKYQRITTTWGMVPLAIPILCRDYAQYIEVDSFLKRRGVETRPIIGGCLLAHTAFKGYGNINDFPVAKWSHECGLYIGINQDVTCEMAAELAKELSRL